MGLVVQADGLGFDGDAALTLDLHRVEHLFLHLTGGESTGELNQPVGERRLAVVDMGHDGEIADVREIGHLGSVRSADRPARGGI